MRAAEIDLGAAGPPVSSAGTFAGEALGDGRHVDLAPDLRLRRKTRADQPAHEHVSRPSLEGQPADRLDGPGRLADQHDAVVRVPAQDRGGPSQVTRIDAPGAGEDLAVKSGKAHAATLRSALQGAAAILVCIGVRRELLLLAIAVV